MKWLQIKLIRTEEIVFHTRIGVQHTWWWWCYPTSSEGWGRGGTPRRPNSRATPQGLDQKSKMEEVVPERLGCGSVEEEVSQIPQRVSAGAA